MQPRPVTTTRRLGAAAAAATQQRLREARARAGAAARTDWPCDNASALCTLRSLLGRCSDAPQSCCSRRWARARGCVRAVRGAPWRCGWGARTRRRALARALRPQTATLLALRLRSRRLARLPVALRTAEALSFRESRSRENWLSLPDRPRAHAAPRSATAAATDLERLREDVDA